MPAGEISPLSTGRPCQPIAETIFSTRIYLPPIINIPVIKMIGIFIIGGKYILVENIVSAIGWQGLPVDSGLISSAGIQAGLYGQVPEGVDVVHLQCIFPFIEVLALQLSCFREIQLVAVIAARRYIAVAVAH